MALMLLLLLLSSLRPGPIAAISQLLNRRLVVNATWVNLTALKWLLVAL